jgi:hypothetical protein
MTLACLGMPSRIDKILKDRSVRLATSRRERTHWAIRHVCIEAVLIDDVASIALLCPRGPGELLLFNRVYIYPSDISVKGYTGPYP